MHTSLRRIIAAACIVSGTFAVHAANRDVQFRSIDFTAGIIELYNFGAGDISLDGWRFCTHDFDSQLRYSAGGGLNGITIEAGTSVYIHFNNDAPGADPDRVNRSTVGNFATPLDPTNAYGMQIYFPNQGGSVSFGDSTLIADHIQWKPASSSVGLAERRTAQAVSQTLWSANGDFIETTANTTDIELTDLSGDIVGSPGEYDVTNIIVKRDVQFVSVDFVTGVIELFNFGPVDIPLDGWRFCSHDFSAGLRYTSSSGLNGVTIEAGTSLFVHFNNDAPGADPDRINRSSLGSFATPLDSDAYGIQIYYPNASNFVSFGDGSLIADHVQWNISGQGAGSSEIRTALAVGQGLWTAVGDFVVTTANTEFLELTSNLGGLLHGPASYTATEPGVGLCGDSNCDGMIDAFDIEFFITALLSGPTAWDARFPGGAPCPFDNNDVNDDNSLDGFDIEPFIFTLLNGTCP